VLAAFFALVNTTRPQDADPARQKSEVLGSGTSEPRIISTQMSISPVEKCKKKEHDTVTFSVVIDQYGKPRDYYFQSVQGNAVDDSLLDFARDVVRADSFSPALSAGLPVAVQRAISVDIEACAEQVKDSGGAKVDRITPRALPIQTVRPSPEIPPAINVDTPPAETASPVHVGGNISPPIPLTQPQARYSDQARRDHIEGKSRVTVIVDRYGFPQNPRVVQPLGYGLDEMAIEAIRRYRFRPALKNHLEPVPVLITIEVNFRLYSKGY
jgi:TonB family protein